MNISILNETLSKDDLEGKLIAIMDSNSIYEVNYVNSLRGSNDYVQELAEEFYKEFKDVDQLLENTNVLITFGESESIIKTINLAKAKHIKVISDIQQDKGFKPNNKPKVNITLGTIWDKPEPNVTMVYIGRQGKPLANHLVNGYLGNPFTREEYPNGLAIKLYEVLVQNNHNNIQERILKLLDYGTDIKLCCFCKNKDCHGRIIKEFLDNL